MEYLKKKKKKKKLKVFQNIVAIFEINSTDFRGFCFYIELGGFVVVAYYFHVLL